jgi:hypothetical protein
MGTSHSPRHAAKAGRLLFSVLKRGLNGIYHSVSKEHLHRYLAEYEFRHNHRFLEDGPRTSAAIKASEGKRLKYQDVVS